MHTQGEKRRLFQLAEIITTTLAASSVVAARKDLSPVLNMVARNENMYNPLTGNPTSEQGPNEQDRKALYRTLPNTTIIFSTGTDASGQWSAYIDKHLSATQGVFKDVPDIAPGIRIARTFYRRQTDGNSREYIDDGRDYGRRDNNRGGNSGGGSGGRGGGGAGGNGAGRYDDGSYNDGNSGRQCS